MPKTMDFISRQTFKTPSKARKRKLDSGTVDDSVLERTHQCTRYPFEVVCQKTQSDKESNRVSKTKDPRRRCLIICKPFYLIRKYYFIDKITT